MQYNFDIWYETYDPNFIEISQKSFIPYKWLSYRAVTKDTAYDSPIKPINRYVEFLYPEPELVGIYGNTVKLRQRNHAEIFLLENEKGFKNIDRPHMRQYYKTKKYFDPDPACFDPVYLFYVPWFIDADIEIKFERPAEDSPFLIYPESGKCNKISGNEEFIEPKFIPFRFKKIGSHMNRPGFGRIKIGSAMFDMVFDASDILLERIRNFYGKD